MSNDTLLAAAAFLGLAGLAIWRIGPAGSESWGSSARSRAVARVATWIAAFALIAVIVAAFSGPAARARWSGDAHAVLAQALESFALLPIDAIIRYGGLIIFANGVAILVAALAMAAARLAIRITSPYEPARPSPPDRLILWTAVIVGNAGVAAAGAMFSAPLLGA